VLAVVELRPRPGAQRHRRAVRRDDILIHSLEPLVRSGAQGASASSPASRRPC